MYRPINGEGRLFTCGEIIEYAISQNNHMLDDGVIKDIIDDYPTNASVYDFKAMQKLHSINPMLYMGQNPDIIPGVNEVMIDWFEEVNNYAFTQRPVWLQLKRTLEYDFDPKENYDKYEDWTDDNTHADVDTQKGTNSNTTTNNLTSTVTNDSNNTTTNNLTDTSTHTLKAVSDGQVKHTTISSDSKHTDTTTGSDSNNTTNTHGDIRTNNDVTTYTSPFDGTIRMEPYTDPYTGLTGTDENIAVNNWYGEKWDKNQSKTTQNDDSTTSTGSNSSSTEFGAKSNENIEQTIVTKDTDLTTDTDKKTGTITNVEKGNSKNVNTGTVTNAGNNSSTNENNGSYNNVHKGHIHGNIGVTTTSAMYEEFRRLVLFNLWDHIIDDIANNCTVGIFEYNEGVYE